MQIGRRRHLLREQANDLPPGGGGNPPQDPPADPPPSDPPPQDPPPADPPAPAVQSVSIDEHQKALAKIAKLEQADNDNRAKLKKQELDQLKGQEKWKEIADLREQENETLRTENDNLKSGMKNREKMSAIRSAAQTAGIRKEALDLLERFDFPEVQIETTSLGNVNIVGAQTAIEAFKLKHPYAFGQKSGNLNGGLPEVTTSGKITLDQVLAADAKARKTGSAEDRAAYNRITTQYQQQQRGG